MNELEARVRCLELAATLSAPTGDRSPKTVVEIATTLYTFTQSLPVTENEPVADKLKRVKKASVPDIMS
ncbi:hypothetical protein UFOVP147_32 [uncultured Caudovirales phage]|uniref:Uncharacterized protein n=1 Tax=uncultured Caudovirales phage TaxID=2100421 RepID=A0A6J7W5R7_9CAUD|nr:hypothetical protein UFOVP147_32 [uncultured Caudovirales phage]